MVSVGSSTGLTFSRSQPKKLTVSSATNKVKILFLIVDAAESDTLKAFFVGAGHDGAAQRIEVKCFIFIFSFYGFIKVAKIFFYIPHIVSYKPGTVEVATIWAAVAKSMTACVAFHRLVAT